MKLSVHLVSVVCLWVFRSARNRADGPGRALYDIQLSLFFLGKLFIGYEFFHWWVLSGGLSSGRTFAVLFCGVNGGDEELAYRAALGI